jgi:hypothetical protein
MKTIAFLFFLYLLQNSAQATDYGSDDGIGLLQHELFQADMLFRTHPENSAHQIIMSVVHDSGHTYLQTLPQDIEGGFIIADDGNYDSSSLGAQGMANVGYFVTATRYLTKPFAAVGRYMPPRNNLPKREQTMMGVGTCAAAIGAIAFGANQCWSGINTLNGLAYQSIRQVRSNSIWGKYDQNPGVALFTHLLPNSITSSFSNYCSTGPFGIAAQSIKALISVTAEYKCWELIDQLQGLGWDSWYAGLFGKGVEAAAQISISTLAAAMTAAVIEKPIIPEVIGSIATGIGFYIPKLTAEFGFNHRYKPYNRYIGLGVSVGVALLLDYAPATFF